MPELGTNAHFQVVNPARFIAQRLPILSSRPSTAKKGKDALYVHDVLQLFTHRGRVHNEVSQQAKRVSQTLTAKQEGQICKTAAQLGDPSSSPIKEAARIAMESLRPDPPSPQAIALVCSRGSLLGRECRRVRMYGTFTGPMHAVAVWSYGAQPVTHTRLGDDELGARGISLDLLAKLSEMHAHIVCLVCRTGSPHLT